MKAFQTQARTRYHKCLCLHNTSWSSLDPDVPWCSANVYIVIPTTVVEASRSNMVANIDDMIATCKLHKHSCDINSMKTCRPCSVEDKWFFCHVTSIQTWQCGSRNCQRLSTCHVVTWHFVRNGRWHPTAIGCGHPPASKSTFGRRSPLDVSMSKTVTAQWIQENIFKCNQHIDRYIKYEKTSTARHSPVHFSICSTCPTCPFEQRNQPAWPKTPRQEFICPSQYTAVVWRPCSIEAALLLYRSNSSMDGCLDLSLKDFPKESDLKYHHSFHTHSKAIRVSLPFTITTPGPKATLLWWWAAKA